MSYVDEVIEAVVRIRGDGRTTRRRRGYQARYGEARAYGQTALRRCRIRQNGVGSACGFQGCR